MLTSGLKIATGAKCNCSMKQYERVIFRKQLHISVKLKVEITASFFSFLLLSFENIQQIHYTLLLLMSKQCGILKLICQVFTRPVCFSDINFSISDPSIPELC